MLQERSEPQLVEALPQAMDRHELGLEIEQRRDEARLDEGRDLQLDEALEVSQRPQLVDVLDAQPEFVQVPHAEREAGLVQQLE